MKTRDSVIPTLMILIFIAIMMWGTAPDEGLNAFGIFMAATCFALGGWHSFFYARQICAERSIIARRYYPKLLQRIWSPASFRTPAMRLGYQAGGVVFFLISAFLFCVAVRRLFS
jgi:hypothetical protein